MMSDSDIGRRRRQFGLRALLLFVLLLGCIFAIIELALRRDAHAVAYIRIAPPNSSLGFVDTAEYQAFLSLHQSRIKSPEIVSAVLTNPKVSKLQVISKQQDATDWLRRNIQVSHPVNSDLIVLKLHGKPLDQANQVLDAIVDAYMNSVKNNIGAKQLKSLGRSRAE
jgi:hypothetical protein